MYFIKIDYIIFRNIEEGNARSKPKAKQIGIFRKYAVDLGMDSQELESVLLSSIDDARYYGEDESEDVTTLQKGVKEINFNGFIWSTTCLSLRKLLVFYVSWFLTQLTNIINSKRHEHYHQGNN